MNSSFFNFIYYFIIVVIIFISIFFIPFYNNLNLNNNEMVYINNSIYPWPIPGYYKITSYFGKRTSPTSGASSFHKGIDIGAPENTNLYSIIEGIVTYIGFAGSGGYTIIISNNNFKVTYCHISPSFIVSLGDFISAGQLIGYVGPKNIHSLPNNPYKDENGNPTNGATTGSHLHLSVSINGELVNPLDLYN